MLGHQPTDRPRNQQTDMVQREVLIQCYLSKSIYGNSLKILWFTLKGLINWIPSDFNSFFFFFSSKMPRLEIFLTILLLTSGVNGFVMDIPFTSVGKPEPNVKSKSVTFYLFIGLQKMLIINYLPNPNKKWWFTLTKFSHFGKVQWALQRVFVHLWERKFGITPYLKALC